MMFFELLALLVVLSALFSYLNHLYLRLPAAIGVMLLGLLLSGALLGLQALGVGWVQDVRVLLAGIDLNAVLMHGILSFLLFASALHVDLAGLVRHRWPIGVLALCGTLLCTALVSVLTWAGLNLLGLEPGWPLCLLFGALISPTDPVAVLAILRRAGVRESLRIKITGESLFNDGVGIVVFTLIAAVVLEGVEFTGFSVLLLFLREVLGGVLLGLLLGYVCYLMLRSVEQIQVELLLTLALVMGGYALALKLHVSGPLAMVAAGLLIGNHGRLLAMGGETRRHLDDFWHLLDELLNSVLFLLLGLNLLVLGPDPTLIPACLLAIVIVLGSRLVSVALPIYLLRGLHRFSPRAVRVLTWGGIRGGISVALALSLEDLPGQELLLAMTYSVVVWSICVQGPTIPRVAGAMAAADAAADDTSRAR